MAQINDDAQVQSDQEIENALFEKLTPKTETVEKEEPEVEGQPETEDEAADGQAEPEVEDPDTEEFEFQGKTYKAPKDLKKAVLRKKDHTEKIMSLAEERKLVQHERETLKMQSEFQSKYSEHMGKLTGMESQLKQYEGVDWEALLRADRDQYYLHRDKRQDLLNAYQSQHGHLQNLTAEFQREMTAQREKKLQAGKQMLRHEFKDEPADLGDRMLKVGESYGFTRQELDMLDDPRQARVLRDAMKWRELQTAKPQVHKRADQAKPVKVTTARSTQSTQSAAQVDNLRATVKKTGSDKAAEDLFTKLLSRKR